MNLWRNKKEAKQRIHEVLATNDRQVGEALRVLLSYQVAGEREAKCAAYVNGMGFNSGDAEFLTSLAEWYVEKGFLSPRQLELARKKLPKYWNQLRLYAEDRASTRDEPERSEGEVPEGERWCGTGE